MPEKKSDKSFKYMVRQARWYPRRWSELLVLYNDNCLRLITVGLQKAYKVISLMDQSPSVGLPTEYAVDFDFLPEVKYHQIIHRVISNYN